MKRSMENKKNAILSINYLLARQVLRSRSRSFYFFFILGVAIAVTPNLIIPGNLIKHPGRFLGQLFCRLLVSQLIVFLLGVVSVYTVVFLSIERWLAVKYPFRYRISISSTKMKICIVIIWLLALIANAPYGMDMTPSNKQIPGTFCKWKFEESQTRSILAVFEFLLKFVIPTVILLLVLISLYKEFHHESTNIDYRSGRHRNRDLLRMCASTSIAVLLCWSPNQIYYTLYKFDKVRLGTNLQHFTIILAISTSSINPVIYFVTSKTYRTCLLNFLKRVFGKCQKKPAANLSTRILAEQPNIEEQ